MRISAGIEDEADLIADLEMAMAKACEEVTLTLPLPLPLPLTLTLTLTLTRWSSPCRASLYPSAPRASSTSSRRRAR